MEEGLAARRLRTAGPGPTSEWCWSGSPGLLAGLDNTFQLLGRGAQCECPRSGRACGLCISHYRNAGANLCSANLESKKQHRLFHTRCEALYVIFALHCLSKAWELLDPGTYLEPVTSDVGLWVCISAF